MVLDVWLMWWCDCKTLSKNLMNISAYTNDWTYRCTRDIVYLKFCNNVESISTACYAQKFAV